jgi:signal transduction histidine kinase
VKAINRGLRDLVGGRAGGETARAFLLFGVCLVALAAIAGLLAFRDLSRMVLARRADVARQEAVRIAQAVAALGRDRNGIDFHRIRQGQGTLLPMIQERLVGRPFLRQVEIRDRFGGRLLSVGQSAPLQPPRSSSPDEGGGALSDAPDKILTVQLGRGARPEGEVRVAISQETSQSELDDLRRSLQIKVGVSAAFGIGILILGFFYVLNLIRKNRLLEQSRLAAERRSYVGLLASGLAHEIRNPLNAMNMNLQMLEEELQGGPGLAAADWGELLTSTKSEIKRLERLVNNFLAYARPAEPRFEPRDLNVVLQEVAKFLQADFRQSAVNLALELEPLLPTVEMDVTQLKQALMNLLVNARQVLRSGGTVVLRSRAGAGGEAVIEVEDDGPGIALEDREKIFQVFYSNRGGGTGLGLPIARQIVERHGGTLEVAAGRERGTVFRIRIPRRHAEASETTPGAAGGGTR